MNPRFRYLLEAVDTIRELADVKNDKALNPTVQLQRLEQQVHVLNEGGVQRFGVRCSAKKVDRRQLVKGLANVVDERKPRGGSSSVTMFSGISLVGAVVGCSRGNVINGQRHGN
jgi:hypothetical protein